LKSKTVDAPDSMDSQDQEEQLAPYDFQFWQSLALLAIVSINHTYRPIRPV